MLACGTQFEMRMLDIRSHLALSQPFSDSFLQHIEADNPIPFDFTLWKYVSVYKSLSTDVHFFNIPRLCLLCVVDMTHMILQCVCGLRLCREGEVRIYTPVTHT